MKCITHSDIDAVATCVRCSAGICQECTNGTFYKIDNKPLCKKCNYEVGLENNSIFKSALRGKQIKMIIFLITFVVGLVFFIFTKNTGHSTFSSVFYMLLCWGVGFIGNFFDKKTDNRSVKTQVKDAYGEIKHPFATLIGKILGFFIVALTSPIQILACLIGIIRVKKQISENENVLNRFIAENT
jgi:hypothetical protein